MCNVALRPWLPDAIVEELRPHLRGVSDKQMRCDRLADLKSLLSKGLPPNGPAIYVVIDDATRLLEWRGGELILPALMKLSEMTGAWSSDGGKGGVPNFQI